MFSMIIVCFAMVFAIGAPQVARAEENSMTETECSTLFKNHDHKECCDAPGPRLNDLFRVCRRRCRSPGTCCAYDCYQDCLQIFVDGKLNVDKMLETFEDDLVAMPEIEWKPIIKKSIETCLKLIPETTEVEKCNGSSSMYLDLIYRCVKKLNFLACPNFNNTEKCKATKEFIENNDKCGEKVGETFVISISYWVDLRSRKTSDVKTYLESEIAAKRYRANERCMLELVHHNPQACCKIEAANMQEVVSSCQEKRRNGANMTVEQCFQEAAFFDGKPQVATILKTFEPESKDVNSKAVIEKSIDTCSKPFFQVVSGNSNSRCNTQFSIMDFYNCLSQMNFMNCPNFNDTPECRATKDFVESDKCGDKFGEIFLAPSALWHLRKSQSNRQFN